MILGITILRPFHCLCCMARVYITYKSAASLRLETSLMVVSMLLPFSYSGSVFIVLIRVVMKIATPLRLSDSSSAVWFSDTCRTRS
jgi:hypothetical protein